MGFFKNSDINRVYIHAGLQSLAYGSGGVFVYAYLLKAGIPAPFVLLAIAGIMVFRLVFRLALVPIVRRIGLRNALIFGTITDAASYLLLPFVKGADGWLLAYIAAASFGTTFYWTCYHGFVARQGDQEHRGAQVSAREAIAAATGIIGPLLGGLALTYLGPVHAFAATAVVNALACIPLLGADRLPIPDQAKLSTAERRFAFAVTFSDGIVAAAANFVWRIALFQTLGESFETFGGAVALASLLGAAMGLGVGRLIDQGHHQRSLIVGIAAMTLAVITMVFGFGSVWTAIAANLAGAVALPLYISAIMAPYYNAGQDSACSFRFNVTGENGFDTGALVGSLIAALLLWAGLDYRLPLAVGIAGCCTIYIILRRHRSMLASG
jgi:DHA1 family inner membrane transport protein